MVQRGRSVGRSRREGSGRRRLGLSELLRQSAYEGIGLTRVNVFRAFNFKAGALKFSDSSVGDHAEYPPEEKLRKIKRLNTYRSKKEKMGLITEVTPNRFM